MKHTINWEMLDSDSVNGFGLLIKFTFNSFDYDEIQALKKWCENHVGTALVMALTLASLPEEDEKNEG